MTYGEMKDYVLQLLNVYSIAGKPVAVTYNDQADLIARIPPLVRDGLLYIATSTRRLRTTTELAAPEQAGDFLVYDLPDDCFQLCAGLLQMQGRRLCRFRDYLLSGGRQILIPKTEQGRFWVEYFRYPSLPEGKPEDDDFLDCPPEVQPVLAYYVASHLAMEDNNYLHGALYNEFEMKMLRLQEGPYLECGVTADVYS